MSEVLVLRTCAADGSSYDGFRWPLTVGAEVVAPDWDATPQCGRGLHGALHGEGEGALFRWEHDAVWMVVATDSELVVDLKGKVKFPRCVIRFIGDCKSATDYLVAHDPMARVVIGATVTGGEGAILKIKWFDGKRYRVAIGYVGENGIEPNVAYRCDDAGCLVRA